MKTEHKVVLWPIGKIKPYAKNAKIHTAEQVADLAKSISKFGWTSPIVVDVDGVIIAGHGRYAAAQLLGLVTVPLIHRDDLTKAEANALRLADNRVASTLYDTEMIQIELLDLAESGFDMSVIGFSDKELAFMTEDMDALNSDVFVEDVGAAVETQKAENVEAVKAVDEQTASTGEAFGFKKLTVAQTRRVQVFMGRIEAETKTSGAAALMAFFDEFGIEA